MFSSCLVGFAFPFILVDSKIMSVMKCAGEMRDFPVVTINCFSLVSRVGTVSRLQEMHK